MALVTMVMPTMGESVMEATILQWLKQEGDMITEEESILEVATDKVDSEVPAPYAGRLQKVLALKGEIVKIGAPLAIIATAGEALIATPILPIPAITLSQSAVVRPLQPMPVLQMPAHKKTDGRFYSPLVLHIAQQEKISPQALSRVPGTGKDNRVTKHDLLAYLQHRSEVERPLQPTVAYMPIAPEDEVIQLDRMRQMIAERMVASKHIAPHVTSFVEADVTDLVQWRNQHKENFEQKTGTKLTYTLLFLQAIVRAIKDFPLINAFVAADRMIKKKAINIGLAVALPNGNLMVPVIKHADQLSLVELAQKVQTLVHKARHQQLVPDELAEATYTVSNLGSFQNLMGTPIILQPQVAILALGAIVKKPAVIESSEGDIIAIRHKMYLSHSYDHRVIDGALGGGFVKQVADYLETLVDWVCW
jgi:2-oxoglutarate dehydrogenase E2 component (dihydrolipoamide succinyltransferase)